MRENELVVIFVDGGVGGDEDELVKATSPNATKRDEQPTTHCIIHCYATFHDLGDMTGQKLALPTDRRHTPNGPHFGEHYHNQKYVDE
ncbi:unnamed protein product [Orchesella dallaii]|uniref:Uncharacterized protein n=1 Tax=Orchesella dallaii TaxID=48710 RepID=A0ABP1RW52_9HEXA